ncbi:hypothetical protein SCHPADRAFT_754958 [Schizopora paradoxa]|uniref:Uncharacterized protein n=1 Tax=Schizopora paradoxa TaxID=27342 RepID=A0A0H2QYG4_9AGAM|nr:hypothetical protein SCHPADRAFT_754958 [Schizopora paradoxa]
MHAFTLCIESSRSAPSSSSSQRRHALDLRRPIRPGLRFESIQRRSRVVVFNVRSSGQGQRQHTWFMVVSANPRMVMICVTHLFPLAVLHTTPSPLPSKPKSWWYTTRADELRRRSRWSVRCGGYWLSSCPNAIIDTAMTRRIERARTR